jgi:hypothetical protein
MRANRSSPRPPASIGSVKVQGSSSLERLDRPSERIAERFGRPAPKTSTMFARYSRRAAVMVRSAIRRCQGEKRKLGKSAKRAIGDALLPRPAQTTRAKDARDLTRTRGEAWQAAGRWKIVKVQICKLG